MADATECQTAPAAYLLDPLALALHARLRRLAPPLSRPPSAGIRAEALARAQRLAARLLGMIDGVAAEQIPQPLWRAKRERCWSAATRLR